MNKEKFMPFVLPIVCIILGVLAIITADGAMQILCYTAAGVLIVFGAIYIIQYLRRTPAENLASNGFVYGCVLLLLGAAAIIKVDSISDLIPSVLGFLIALNGVQELQKVIDMRKSQLHSEWIALVVAVVNLILGIILIINPGFTVSVLMTVSGVILIISGVADLVTTAMVYGKAHRDAQ